jgi:HEPN domain-containing protein
VVKADEDLKAADMLLAAMDAPTPVIAFHAQQCSEKYLKALLTLRSVTAPRTHDLTRLRQLVPRDVALRVEDHELAALTAYAVEARYPGGFAPVARQDAEKAVSMARNVREAVRRLLPDYE